ncbi:MAG: hypothetical protein HOP28_09805 [Gemmatimonadales bacterium]|nr:hypothetical protein [Gemmatimonadales bacterium]
MILQGPHGYTVQFLGATERMALNREYAYMLARLRKIRDLWCFPDKQGHAGGNKVAVIYGAGGAIGGGVARAFARKGTYKRVGNINMKGTRRLKMLKMQ